MSDYLKRYEIEPMKAAENGTPRARLVVYHGEETSMGTSWYVGDIHEGPARLMFTHALRMFFDDPKLRIARR